MNIEDLILYFAVGILTVSSIMMIYYTNKFVNALNELTRRQEAEGERK